jgi:hypothetical protein
MGVSQKYRGPARATGSPAATGRVNSSAVWSCDQSHKMAEARTPFRVRKFTTQRLVRYLQAGRPLRMERFRGCGKEQWDDRPRPRCRHTA